MTEAVLDTDANAGKKEKTSPFSYWEKLTTDKDKMDALEKMQKKRRLGKPFRTRKGRVNKLGNDRP